MALAASVLAQAAYALLYGVPDPASYFLAPLALGLALAPALVAALPAARRAAVVEALARTGQPVLVFLPQMPSVRLLREGTAEPAR